VAWIWLLRWALRLTSTIRARARMVLVRRRAQRKSQIHATVEE